MEKKYNEQSNIGKSKYVVNHYDGEKKNKDGSPFFDIATFKNMKDKNNFIAELKSKGYKPEYKNGGGVGENEGYDSVYEIHIKEGKNGVPFYVVWDKIDGVENGHFAFKTDAENWIKSKKYATGGGVEDEDDEEEEMDWGKLSDVEEELGRLYKWKNQYGSKGSDAKIKQLEKRIRYLKSNNKYKDGGGVGFRNIDKIKSNIGETVFNHINSLSKTELEKQLSELKEELKSVNNDGGQRYLKLKDEEFYLLYRLERANEFKYKNGGGIDINELNMPVIRTQFEDEEYEFKDGGEVEENEDVLKVAKAIFDNNNKKGKIKTSFGDKTLVGLKAMIENTNYDSEVIASSIFSVNEKKGKISTSFGDKYYGGLLAMINHSRANKLKNYNLGQMANGGTTKGFCYTIGGL
jgi:hypothetical protein